MLSRLFGSRKPQEVHFAAPVNTRIYAVGDIHGRIDLLRNIHRKIAEDAERASNMRLLIVYLGDYVDRGHESQSVIDAVLDETPAGFDAVYLCGNHEDAMLTFLEDPSIGPNWFLNGGDSTLYSYGVGQPRVSDRDERLQLLQKGLQKRLPRRHVEFLNSLKLFHIEGDYLFVHAGIRPGRTIDKQDRRDLLWIRDEFLRSNSDHGVCVVHGHTICEEVEVRHNRIGIDTGAYYTGKLSCLALEGKERWLLQTDAT